MKFWQIFSAKEVESGSGARIYWLLEESHVVVVSTDFHGVFLLSIGPASAIVAMALRRKVVVCIVTEVILR